jgi:hypothetical protein
MDALREFLEDLQRHGDAQGNLLGLFHVLIGRRVSRTDGTVISTGMPWRSLAHVLKKVHWPKEAVRELGQDPATLPPRDRERYWYAAISRAGVDSAAAVQAGDRLAEALQAVGYVVGPAPGTHRSAKD